MTIFNEFYELLGILQLFWWCFMFSFYFNFFNLIFFFILFVCLFVKAMYTSNILGPLWIYNYLCHRCLSLQMSWVRIPLIPRCTTLCNKVIRWLVAGQWFFSGYSGFLLVHQYNWQPRYNWNIVESDVKPHKTKTTLIDEICVCNKHQKKCTIWLKSAII